MLFKWKLPQEWCHSGIPQGNGLFGTMLWGNPKTLKITFNRADYWFHGHNLPPDSEQSYNNLKKYLSNNDECELWRVFGGSVNGQRPLKSTRLPMGSIHIALSENITFGEMQIETDSSLAEVSSSGIKIKSLVPRGLPILAISITGNNSEECKLKSCPPQAQEIKKFFEENFFPSSKIIDEANGDSGGWTQPGKNSESLCVMWKKIIQNDSVVFLMTAMLAETVEKAVADAKYLLNKISSKSFEEIYQDTAKWWQKYWQDTPVVNVPDREMMELYYWGMYRMAGLIAPEAPPATLQGAWLEDYRMAPWSNDYHFNINVQECYWPVFAGNHPEYILPLFKMVKSWKKVLREYAKNFVGIDDGQMLPHAVDNHGIALGGFWPGHVDHSCTAWTAQLMWQYWRYTLDDEFMCNTLYPFMKETMNVYAEMLEEDDEGNLFLAVESSPEYFEKSIKAWGKNSTIHLSSIHFLINSLLELSSKLNIDTVKRVKWQDISKRLPIAAMTEDKEICIWDGQLLAQPHRHFSHLIGVYPYDLFNWRTDAVDTEIVNRTINKWITQGTGLWSGWSFPWASIIYSRLENAESAHTMLSAFRRGFMKDDFAYRYLPDNPVFTSIKGPDGPSIMQIEAGIASAAAVLEMCVYTSRGVIYPMVGIPCYWKNISFRNIRTEGALLVSGERRNGVLQNLTIKALKGGNVKIALPKGEYQVKQKKINGGNVYEIVLGANEELVILTQI